MALTRNMTALFELPLPSETLAADELSEITGARTRRRPSRLGTVGPNADVTGLAPRKENK